jgi:EAL domain-containing protein (putative c-di-GMP-specific phosphodiesterase class I)
VETRNIANQLREIGVDFAQGYYFSKPEPLIDTDTIASRRKTL